MLQQADNASQPNISLSSDYLANSRMRVDQRVFVLIALAAIALVDQGLKWWAWRHAPGVRINYGGDILVPANIGSLYAHPMSGALLDLLDSGLLIIAVSLFLRRQHSPLVLLSGSLIIGGWSSDLLDRLFMHYCTAPGSVRGVVDFLPFGHRHYNVADLCIIFGTPLFILATTRPALRQFFIRKPDTATHVLPSTHRPLRGRKVMLALAVPVALTPVVAFGAANFGGTSAPTTSATALYQPTLVTRNGVFFENGYGPLVRAVQNSG
jgi:lipoprotein signal peptidase